MAARSGAVEHIQIRLDIVNLSSCAIPAASFLVHQAPALAVTTVDPALTIFPAPSSSTTVA